MEYGLGHNRTYETSTEVFIRSIDGSLYRLGGKHYIELIKENLGMLRDGRLVSRQPDGTWIYFAE